MATVEAALHVLIVAAVVLDHPRQLQSVSRLKH